MKWILNGLLIVVIQGCVSDPVTTANVQEQMCVGTTELNHDLSDKFEEVQDPASLSQALGEPFEGKLCQGTVYQSTQEVTIYRAWNSTNPGSQFGQGGRLPVRQVRQQIIEKTMKSAINGLRSISSHDVP